MLACKPQMQGTLESASQFYSSVSSPVVIRAAVFFHDCKYVDEPSSSSAWSYTARA